ncbi:MAG: hypothetical protein OJF50_006377 [Nitrospira sp.]|jgi:hypothetical protein|nr:hypothetical protein [Nitrospira sp.]
MRAVLLGIMAGLLIGCVSAARIREAQCFGTLMLDVWNSEQELDAMEGAWRTAQQARSERSSAFGESLVQSALVADTGVPSTSVALLPQQDSVAGRWQDVSEEQVLYRQFVERRARHRETVDWYGRVAHRVETRLEEDEMLYPVLGMLATSTAIIFYPIVRWNVRSVLWDGVDPDAEDDPVQRFCINRLAGGASFPPPSPAE